MDTNIVSRINGNGSQGRTPTITPEFTTIQATNTPICSKNDGRQFRRDIPRTTVEESIPVRAPLQSGPPAAESTSFFDVSRRESLVECYMSRRRRFVSIIGAQR